MYSSFAIWFSAALLWFIFLDEKKNGRKKAIYWKGLSFVFLYLGLDELASIHEHFGSLAPFIWKHAPWLSSIRDWVIPFIPVVIAFGVYFFRFYRDLPRVTRTRFTLAGAVYVGGAVGVEVFAKWYQSFGQLEPFYQKLFMIAEEGMEMIGIVLFIRALLIYIREYISQPDIDVHINLKSETKNNEMTHEASKVITTQIAKSIPTKFSE